MILIRESIFMVSLQAFLKQMTTISTLAVLLKWSNLAITYRCLVLIEGVDMKNAKKQQQIYIAYRYLFIVFI